MKKPSFISKLAVGATALGVAVAMLPGASANTTYVPNGLSSETAAASCWEVKQNDPESTSGTYWLYTPSMDAPAQFYCDQETDGGGWVMIGRGREGWTEEYQGRGKAEDIFTKPTGSEAFTPAQLSSDTVDELLDGERVDSLEDGVRFRRAVNAEGTDWQNVYAKRINTESWSWTLQANTNWGGVRFENPSSIGGSRIYGLTTGGIASWNQSYNTLRFTSAAVHGWKNGFAYGSYVRGNTDASSYLWTPTGTAPMGFTQVFIRPKINQNDAGFAQIPDSGLAAEDNRQLPNSFTAPMRWRTSMESGTGVVSELNTRVQAIAQVGNTVFTGGDFKNVVSASGETVEQGYLAGYDVNSAELVRSFTPKFNGQIKALESLPSGLLAVGGEFTEVNGQPANGFVILNPVTGETDTSLGWDIVNRVSGAVPVVKTIQVQGGYVYIGGSFTHVKGGTGDFYTYSRNAARFNVSDKGVDVTWRPVLNGTVNGVSASEDGVALAGYFTKVNDVNTVKLAYLSPTSGTISKPWVWKPSYPINTTNGGFQFDVQHAHSEVWAGGSEHLIAQYSLSDLSRMSSSITRTGGDFQDLHLDTDTDVMYGACHCGDWVYEGADLYQTPWNTAVSDIHRIRLVGAFDAQTGEVLPEFSPEISGDKGYGVWESFVDSNGVLWAGGDITRSRGSGGGQSTVGFVRFTPRDIAPAAAPSNLQVTTDGTTDELTWTSGTRSRTDYQVLRDNRVIATVKSGTSYSVAHTDGARYFVRSVDNVGNYSETTPVATTPVPPVEEPVDPPVEEPAPNDPAPPVVDENPDPADPVEPVEPEAPADQKLVVSGDRWDVTFGLTNIYDRTWRDTNYAYNTGRQWYTGPSSIGWGEPSLASNLSFSWWNQPNAMFLRKELTVNPAAGQSLVLTTYADDGMAIYVNGKEVHRENLATNATASSMALARVAYSDAKLRPITITIPASELNQGKNVIAAQVHAYRRGESATFDMEATLKNP